MNYAGSFVKFVIKIVSCLLSYAMSILRCSDSVSVKLPVVKQWLKFSFSIPLHGSKPYPGTGTFRLCWCFLVQTHELCQCCHINSRRCQHHPFSLLVVERHACIHEGSVNKHSMLSEVGVCPWPHTMPSDVCWRLEPGLWWSGPVSWERNSVNRTGKVMQPCFRPLAVAAHLQVMSFGPLTCTLVFL